MKEIKVNVKRFDVGNGFIVEIDYECQCMGHPTVDAILWHKDYGIRMEMFGAPKDRPDEVEIFEDVVEANLDEYIEMYREEYMDE